MIEKQNFALIHPECRLYLYIGINYMVYTYNKYNIIYLLHYYAIFFSTDQLLCNKIGQSIRILKKKKTLNIISILPAD